MKPKKSIEQKKEENALQQRDEFSRAILENALDGIAVVESGGNLRYVSPSIEWILGYPQGEKIATNLFALVHPDDLPAVRMILERLWGTLGMVQKTEFRLRHKDGDWRGMEVTGKSHEFKNPSFRGVVLNYRDLFETQSTERAATRLAAIVESSNDAIYSVTLEGVLLSWNPGAERIYGFKPEEIGGRDVSAITLPEQREEFRRLLETVRQGKAVSNFTATHRSKAGAPILLSMTLSPIKDSSGRVARASVIARDITESEKSKIVKTMLQGERDQLLERLQLQMERMPIACVLNDENGHITYWNPAAERIFGFSFREVEGKSLKEVIVPPSAWGVVDDIFQQLRKGDPSPQGFVGPNLRKDGKAIYCEWYGAPFFDVEGRFTGFMGMAIDVTERRKADEVKSRLAGILEQTSDAVIITDLEGVVVDWNRGAEQMYGYKAGEVVGKPIFFLEPPDRSGEIAGMIQKVHQSGKLLGVETKRKKRNGKSVDVSITLAALKNTAGEVVGVSAITRDITQHKKAEEVQSQLVAILQQTRDAVIGSDLEGNIYNWNRGAEEMFGYSQEEITGRPISLLAPEDKRHESKELMDIALSGQSVSNFETLRRKKNGEAIDVSITMSPIRDPKGKIAGVSAITRDITEKKQAEESLRKHEEKMRLVEKMNAIGRLAGGVAHDFNNLLSVIGGNAEFLLSSLEKDNPHREELEEIQKSVRRGAELTKQLLVFGQKQVVQPGPVHLNDLTGEMTKMLRRLIDPTINLSILPDKKLKPILADQGQIQQVILNLVLNARDAMPQGGHLILETKTLSARDMEKEKRPSLPKGSYVRLSVTDSGTGMSAEIRSHLFEPFFTTKTGKGTGLGLASVYGIVNKWSGQIFVHSTPGMGSTFSLYFPAMVSVEGFETKANQISLIPQGSETLLLVEDEEPVRKVLGRGLEKFGYKVLEAVNGIEALNKAWGIREKIDLLVTDTVMPKMNGKELADELRKTRPRLKVLFVSGYPREILSQQGILGADINLMQKPFELEDLGREIRKILDER